MTELAIIQGGETLVGEADRNLREFLRLAHVPHDEVDLFMGYMRSNDASAPAPTETEWVDIEVKRQLAADSGREWKRPVGDYAAKPYRTFSDRLRYTNIESDMLGAVFALGEPARCRPVVGGIAKIFNDRRTKQSAQSESAVFKLAQAFDSGVAKLVERTRLSPRLRPSQNVEVLRPRTNW